MRRVLWVIAVVVVFAAVLAGSASSHPWQFVTVVGNGRVDSTSDDSNSDPCPGCFDTQIVNCNSSNSPCQGIFAGKAIVTLTATPVAGNSISWSGGSCSGNGSTCTVVMPVEGVERAPDVTVTFAPITTNYTLSVSTAGAGVGSVSSSPAGISCPSTCAFDYPSGTAVTLTASPNGSSDFAGWSGGGCNGTGTCVVTMSSAQSVTATFTPKSVLYTVSVSKNGAGTGKVVSSPAGIDCGGTCSAGFNGTVQLTAVPDPGSAFTAWGGACSGTGTCTLNVNAAKAVTATFASAPNTFPVVVTKTGTGSGTVTSAPAGINCGTTCVASMSGSVQLTAVPAAGSTFGGWSGACTGSSLTCTLSVTASQSVTADFEPSGGGGGPFTLRVVRGGSGSGTVTSSPAGIACGSTCVATVSGQFVLTAKADAGSVFAGWSGDCAGSNATCTVIVDRGRSVTATFNSSAFRLTAVRAGTGSGTIRSSPAGISCGKTCGNDFSGTVRLTAVAASGSAFTGWSGACRGAGACLVRMSAAKRVVAQFADVRAPVVHPAASSGRMGRTAVLKFSVVEASGTAATRVTISRGRTTIARLQRGLTSLAAIARGLSWHVPASAGTGSLRFCVVATDRAGNQSPSTCATLTIRP